MTKRKRLSEPFPLSQNGNKQTPKAKSPQSQTPKTQTPQSLQTKNPASTNRKSLRSQNSATVKSPSATPRGKQNAGKEGKGMVNQNTFFAADSDSDKSESDDEVDDDFVLNTNGLNSSKLVPGALEDDTDELEAPERKRAKKTSLSEEEKPSERDARSLFLKNLPAKYTVNQIKALSKDILDVRLRVFKRMVKAKGSEEKSQDMRCAFLDFESATKAELNYKQLKGKKIGNKEIQVDYVGKKSTHRSAKESQQNVEDCNKKRLYVAGLSQDVTKTDLEAWFSKCSEVVLPKTRKSQQMLGYAFINFENEADCKTAHDEMQNKIEKGCHLVVLYSTSTHKRNAESENKNETQGGAKEDESDDDEEDDEDDESSTGDDDSDEDKDDSDDGGDIDMEEDDDDLDDDDDDDDDDE